MRSFLWRHFGLDRSWFVIALLLALTFTGIFNHDLWTPDEPRAAEISREFLGGGHWMVPTLDQQPFIEKPPLVYWLGALSLETFGTRDWAVRVAGMLFGIGTLLFTYLIAERLYDKKTALGAVVVLSTTVAFLLRSHHFETDIGLVFFVTATAYFLLRAVNGPAYWYAPAYAFGLGAFFSKGFIGFAFPTLLFLCWTIWSDKPREMLRARPWIGIPLVMTPIVLWFLTLWRYPGGDLLHAFLYNNNFQRFLRSSEGYFGGHEQPWFYYFFQFPAQFFPWVIVLALGIRWFWSERRETASKFILSWFIPGFVLLTLAGTKRGSYLLPILPPLAIWIAAWFVRRRHERWLTLAGATFTLSFVLVSLFVVPQVNELKSLRPFGRELSAQLTPATQLYGYRTDETTRAIVPFYTGHYLKPLERESDLASLANRKEEVAIVVLEQPDRPLVAEVKKFFPYAWIAHDKGDVRHMWVLSNVKKRQT